MKDKEFRDKVYEKYQYYKDTKDDKYFYKKIDKKITLSIMNVVASFVIIFFSVSIILIGGLSTYAFLGGTVGGKPVLEWFKISFSDDYSKYVEEPEEKQSIARAETEVKLVSTMCNEGFTVLEFDVGLSKEDKEYLRLGESILTEKDIERCKEEVETMKKSNSSQESIERAQKRVEKFIKEGTEQKNSVRLLFVPEPIKDENNNNDYNLANNNSIFIDNEKQWISPSALQTVQKINDYEYKVYLLYFLTDKNLGDKIEFTLTLKNLVLSNGADISNLSRDFTNSNAVLVSGGDNRKFIEIGGEFNIPLSKKKALEDTTIIKNKLPEPIKYRNMTKSVEEVILTPVQTIIKLKSTIEDLSLLSLSQSHNKNYIGIIEYKAYDENGKELKLLNYETRRIVTYADGRTEEWAPLDIGTYKSFYNGKMELTEYIILEKNENIKNIVIQPIVTQPTYNPAGAVEGSTEPLYIDKKVELDKFEINMQK